MIRGGAFAGIENGRALAQVIVDTVREPLLVLDQDLRVVAASRSFYMTFHVNRQETQGRLLYALGDGQWDPKYSPPTPFAIEDRGDAPPVSDESRSLKMRSSAS